MKVQFSFLFLGNAIYFGYIPNLYNLAGFSLNRLARFPLYFQYGFAIIFLDKGIVESILFVVINEGFMASYIAAIFP
jgi:hypothetical protein